MRSATRQAAGTCSSADSLVAALTFKTGNMEHKDLVAIDQ